MSRSIADRKPWEMPTAPANAVCDCQLSSSRSAAIVAPFCVTGLPLRPVSRTASPGPSAPRRDVQLGGDGVQQFLGRAVDLHFDRGQEALGDADGAGERGLRPPAGLLAQGPQCVTVLRDGPAVAAGPQAGPRRAVRLCLAHDGHTKRNIAQSASAVSMFVPDSCRTPADPPNPIGINGITPPACLQRPPEHWCYVYARTRRRVLTGAVLSGQHEHGGPEDGNCDGQ